MNFAKRLQDLRKLNNLSQTELAAVINVSDRSVSAWERGLTLPNTETTIKLADYFNVSTDYLLCRDKDVNDTSLDVNITYIQRAYEKLNPQDKQKMFEMNKLMFQKAFDSEDIDDTI